MAEGMGSGLERRWSRWPEPCSLSVLAPRATRRIIERSRLAQIQELGRQLLKAQVKKTFKLNIEGKHPERLLEATKHEIRKYVKRQRRVPLPEGVDFWDFDCKFGLSAESAVVVHFATITALIDAAVKDGADAFYLEMLAKPGHRQTRPADSESEQA